MKFVRRRRATRAGTRFLFPPEARDAQFRYRGTTLAGKAVQGTLTAGSPRAAKKVILEICAQKKIRLQGIDRKSVYVYKVQKGGGKPTKGEQKAYSPDEVDKALRKMGFQVLSVRKQPFTINPSSAFKDASIFIRICADLPRERLPYEEVIQAGVDDTPNKVLRDTLVEINQDLKEGKDGGEVYGKHASVLGKFRSPTCWDCLLQREHGADLRLHRQVPGAN